MTYACPVHDNHDDCLAQLGCKAEARGKLSHVRCPMLRVKQCIIALRRCRRLDKAAMGAFRHTIEDNLDFIVERVNSRWIVSILDTYGDYGDTAERRNAMLGVLLISFDRFVDSVRRCHAGEADELRVRDRKFYDGLTTPSLGHSADTHRNMLCRIGKCWKSTPAVQRMGIELVDRQFKLNPTSTLNLYAGLSNRDIAGECLKAIRGWNRKPHHRGKNAAKVRRHRRSRRHK